MCVDGFPPLCPQSSHSQLIEMISVGVERWLGLTCHSFSTSLCVMCLPCTQSHRGQGVVGAFSRGCLPSPWVASSLLPVTCVYVEEGGENVQLVVCVCLLGK